MRAILLTSLATGVVVSVIWSFLWAVYSTPTHDAIADESRVVALEDELMQLRRELESVRAEARRARPLQVARREEAPAPVIKQGPDLEARQQLHEAREALARMDRQIEGMEEYLRYGGYEPTPMPEAQHVRPGVTALHTGRNVQLDAVAEFSEALAAATELTGELIYYQGAGNVVEWTTGDWKDFARNEFRGQIGSVIIQRPTQAEQ